ncbi:MAG: maleylpyruvate isomerase N-terminal domain-containing protein [Chloroflexota bacterium]|nr:maleylpyruvate isomerase N-terminal domain-containing protein [Chloroflexota bacterium]
MSEANGSGSIDALVAELAEGRAAFRAALDDVDPALLTTPGLVGEWSARELVAHLGYWDGHAADALHAAEDGRTAEFDAEGLDVEARNATVARVAAASDFETVRSREEASFEALLDRLRDADPSWLFQRTASGDTVEQVVREDGADHYREHAADIRAWFAEGTLEDGAGDED